MLQSAAHTWVSPQVSLQAYSHEGGHIDFSFQAASTRWHCHLCANSLGWRVTERDPLLGRRRESARGLPNTGEKPAEAFVSCEVDVPGQLIFVFVNLKGFGTEKLHNDTNKLLYSESKSVALFL